MPACNWLEALWKKLLLVFLVLVSTLQDCANGKPQVPCFFIFGDSISDNGNNNNLVTLAKANYPPYGIDFPAGITGRFTNGRNMVDFIAEFLGFDDYIPPFATARDQEILTGVNYASGAAGIRSETGQQLGDRISMDRQLKNHRSTVSQIITMLGNQNSSAEYLSKCIYSVAIGSNDYINNYFLPKYFPTSSQYTQEQYAEALVLQVSQQLKTLYECGARKVAVFGLGLLGCTLVEKASFGSNVGSLSCVDNVNNAVLLFNNRLKRLVLDYLNKSLTDANFIFVNSSGIALSSSLSQAGPKETNAPCCQVTGTGLGMAQCDPFGKSCSNRSQYTFWDAVHPTEDVYAGYASRAYRAESPTDAYPFDIERLAQL